MEKDVKKQNLFHQTRMNEVKLGAYYTDPEHCKWISGLLEFPKEEEVCCLDPCIGDGKAVEIVTGRQLNQNVHIFGVELNEKTVGMVKGSPEIDECIWGDFLTDVVISNHVFSFCFANPPYEMRDGDRLERRFLGKLGNYLVKEAVLVYVVPSYVAADEKFLTEWCRTYDTELYYRFHEKEYKKWKQIVLVGRKKKEESYKREEIKRLTERLKAVETIPELPENLQGRRIKVHASYEKEVKEFTTKVFDAVHAKAALKKSPLKEIVKNHLVQEKYISDRLGRPPIIPNSGQMYLMAITGAGQGKVGSEETKDLHLQRGVVKNVEESEMRYDDNGNMVEAVQTFSRIHFNIIENNGKIHTL